MKKLFNLLVILVLCATFPLLAQEYNLNDPLPVDNNLRVGHLPNGLTYYLRKNALPKDRVELRLAINAGSILEDEDQQGLAHFTEHMCFNGTKHFVKNELISYLQSVGVKFGSHLNAYTSFDETVYQLFVPTNKDDVVDKAFLVLEDWAHNVTFDPKEIEGERGVITEEWRLGQGADQRLRDKFFPVLFYNSQYAQRLPIGKIDIIKNFKPAQITRFYHDWYRPDLMAVVVVGDIDLDKYEQLIKNHFAGIQNPNGERPRKSFEVPEHPSTLYSIATDKEATQTQFIVYSKKPHKDEVLLKDYRDNLIEGLYSSMLNQRLSELARSANPPFTMARSSNEGISRTKDAFGIVGMVRDNTCVEKGLKVALEEVERVKQYGFTPNELERAKKNLLLMYERQYENRDKSESSSYVGELVRNFLVKEPIPGIEYEYNFTKSQLPGITLQEVNDYDNSFQSDSNRVIIALGPEKEGIQLPKEDALKNIVAEVANEKLTPYSDKKVEFIWPGKKPVAGAIVKEEKNNDLNTTTLTLSNGVKVVLKPTDFKNNEIYITAFAHGGNSLCSDQDYYSAIYASVFIDESGIAGLSKTDLVKALAGKDVSVKLFLNTNSEGLNGRTSPKEMETFFQLANLYFTQPKIDSIPYQTFIAKQKTTLTNMLLSPERYYTQQSTRFMAKNSPRAGGLPDPEDIDKINKQTALDIIKERFANAGNFTFIVVGAIDIDKIKPLLETYVASLPSNSSREKPRDLGIRPPKGNVSKAFYKGKEPKSSVNMIFTGLAKFDVKEDYLLQALNDVLTIKLMESLRESKSGVYGVRASGYTLKYPYENYKEQISFGCAPDNVDSLVNAALKIIDNVKKNGIDEATINKVKETQKHDLEVSIKTNIYWQNSLLSAVAYNYQPETLEVEKAKIDNLSSKELQRVAKKYFGSNYAKLVLYPEK
jgi:zinc protease